MTVPTTTRWVALLRGVNVGGITIRSAALARAFEHLGFTSVRTVLASGNVVFETDAGHAPTARAALKTRIEKGLREGFSYDAWIVLVTGEELAAAASAFPFDDTDEARQPWVVFCVDEPTRGELLAAAAGPGADTELDPVAPGPGVVYWNPPKGSSTDTPFARMLAKKTYKPRTTTRNLRTLAKILG